MIRIERRLEQPRWLSVAVPVISIAVAFLFATIVLLATHHPPLHTFKRLFDAAFLDNGALSETLVSATPLAFTGLCAAVAFRMNLFNIGGEGQLYAGSITGATVALLLAAPPGALRSPQSPACSGRSSRRTRSSRR
jgi:simple sugar transport system permease protein